MIHSLFWPSKHEIASMGCLGRSSHKGFKFVLAALKFWIEKLQSEAGEVAESEKGLPWKHEGLS